MSDTVCQQGSTPALCGLHMGQLPCCSCSRLVSMVVRWTMQARGWYDKLKPFDIAIYGCHGWVSGIHCRCLCRVRWAQVFKSNNDPCVIAQLYLECVWDTKWVPNTDETHYQYTLVSCMMINRVTGNYDWALHQQLFCSFTVTILLYVLQRPSVVHV